MSTFVRFVYSTVFVALLSVGTMPAQAQAVPVLAENTWSPFTTIQYIRQNQTFGNDETYFSLAGTACGNAGQEFYFEASAVAHDAMVKIALSAFMSSRQIRVKHVGCRVYNLWMR